MTSRLIRIGIAAAALFALPPIAQAAELPGDPVYKSPSYKSPAYSAPSQRSWSGFYAGLNGGYGFGSSKWDVPAVSNKPSGALIGGTLGYNFQYSSWLFGLEGDWGFSTMKDDVACSTAICETKNSWLGTARGRVGYAFDSFLPYFTAGVGMGNVKAHRSSLTTTGSHSGFGLAVGAGLEYALWSNWSAKLEYLYVDLGKFDCGTSCGATVNNVSFNANIVRAGINYLF